MSHLLKPDDVFTPANLTLPLLANKFDALSTAVSDAEIGSKAMDWAEYFVRQQDFKL